MADAASALSPVATENRADRAYRELKAAILSGRLQPGASLGEVELAEALGISRTPVREALARLRADGLVDGTAVKELTAAEIRELFLLREALEALAVREFVATHGRGADVSALEALLARQRAARAAGDVEAFLDADEQFHLRIAELAGLPQVAQLLGALREKQRQAGLRAVADPARLPRVLAEHEAIVKAVRAGNADRASAAVLRHLSVTKNAFDSSR